MTRVKNLIIGAGGLFVMAVIMVIRIFMDVDLTPGDSGNRIKGIGQYLFIIFVLAATMAGFGAALYFELDFGYIMGGLAILFIIMAIALFSRRKTW